MTTLARLDSFLYRHRVRDLMSAPLVTAQRQELLQAATERMFGLKISALVVLDADGRPFGIVTERDVMRALTERGEAALKTPVTSVMSSPVATVHQDAFAYTALGRIQRLGYRHLVAVDDGGRAVGMVTARGLLKIRAGQAPALGDRVAVAMGGEDLAAVRAELPGLARQLLQEGVDALSIAAVISAVVREMTARAAELAAQSMEEQGWGGAPAPWSVLVLGSGGRGESLLSFDQDNAIVHDGQASDDAWFAEAGKRMTTILNEAGIPFCKGNVMASNPVWRHNLTEWRAQIDRWIASKQGEALLNVDIFYDFQPVYGDRVLASGLRRHALDAAAASPLFLRMLTSSLDETEMPMTLFGYLPPWHREIDLKRRGLMPLVAAVRVLALKHRIAETSTAERLARLVGEGLTREDADSLTSSLNLMMRIVLDRQIAALETGGRATPKIELRRLSGATRRRLVLAFQRIGNLKWVMRHGLSTV